MIIVTSLLCVLITCMYFIKHAYDFVLICFVAVILSHYNDAIMSSMASQITSLTFIQGADQTKYQSSASLAFVRGIHR